jgi:putative transposase
MATAPATTTTRREEENRKLNQIVADLSLDKAMLKAVIARKL